MMTLNFPRVLAAKPAEPVLIHAPTETPAPAPRTGLCTGCVYAHIVRGYAPREEITFCGYAFPQREVPFAVRECTDYRPKRERDGEEPTIEGAVSFPPLEEMADAPLAMAATRNGEGE